MCKIRIALLCRYEALKRCDLDLETGYNICDGDLVNIDPSNAIQDIRTVRNLFDVVFCHLCHNNKL